LTVSNTILLERKSTGVKVDPALYKEFKMEALRRDMDISDLLDHAMRLVLAERERKRERKENS
jgi:hypothetical protein